jgi:hypothetical protein
MPLTLKIRRIGDINSLTGAKIMLNCYMKCFSDMYHTGFLLTTGSRPSAISLGHMILLNCFYLYLKSKNI